MKQIPLTQGKTALVNEKDFTWLSRFRWQADKIHGNWYARRGGLNSTVLMHREIMQPLPVFLIDHKNHNGLDNRRSNLRICNAVENARNRRPVKKAKCRYKGVSLTTTGRFRAEICTKTDRLYLGCFDSDVEAAIAYDDAAVKLFGQFAYLNFPNRLDRNWIRRKILEAGDKIFALDFRKRSDRTVRSMQARLGVEKGLKNVGLPYRARKHHLLIVYDMAEKDYRAVPIDGIIRLKINSKNYRID